MNCLKIIIVSLATASASFAQTPEDLLRQGLRQYREGEYEAGVEQLEQALRDLPAEPPFDRALLQYNLGIGYYRTTRLNDAVQAFREALKTPDTGIQSQAYFNLGNSLYKSADGAMEEGDIASAFTLYQSAQTNYIQTLRLTPDDRDAKVNYELTLLEQARIMQMVAAALSRLQQGEQLVSDYRFIEAAQWFGRNLPQVEKTLELEPDMKEAFKQMTERSAAVAEILAPSMQGGMPGGQP